MSRCLVVYFSQAGSTARTGERIAAGLRASGFEVKLCNMKDEKPPEVHDYALLGVGFPVYYFSPPHNVSEYVSSLCHIEGMPVFVFTTYGTYRFNAADSIRRELVRKKAREVGYFHCRGADLYCQYLKLGYLFSADNPTPAELAGAEAFGQEVSARLLRGQQLAVSRERTPSLVYRIERLSTNRRLSAWLYSRLFKVDAQKCSACGLCAAHCPVGNITEDKAGHPIWGRNCLLCVTCEMECPEEAIISVQSSSLFRPFLKYNVRKASQDPSIPHVKVTHRHGRTTRTEPTGA